jgi:hypothetical protein
MSTSTKSPSTIRQGGPGASHENAKARLEIKKSQQIPGVAGAVRAPAAAVKPMNITRMNPNERPETKGAANRLRFLGRISASEATRTCQASP